VLRHSHHQPYKDCISAIAFSVSTPGRLMAIDILISSSHRAGVQRARLVV
jgi:hypothetical protein